MKLFNLGNSRKEKNALETCVRSDMTDILINEDDFRSLRGKQVVAAGILRRSVLISLLVFPN